jgi:hypothetical protein
VPTLLLDRAWVLETIGGLFLRAKTRCKDGKSHRYGSLVENRRTVGNRVVQRPVLDRGELNAHQQAAWCRTMEVLPAGETRPRPVALFPADRPAPALACEVVQIRLSERQLHRPRQWGAGGLACGLWGQRRLDAFWAERLAPSRQGTRWLNVLKTLVCYRLSAPGSEWRRHREWSARAAMADRLGEDDGLVQADQRYRCLDKRLAHKRAWFSPLTDRWQALFGVRYEGLLYDLTSTYFECEPPGEGQRRFGYRRDKRSDWVQGGDRPGRHSGGLAAGLCGAGRQYPR